MKKIIALAITLLILPLVALAEGSGPVVDPEAASALFAVLKALAATQPWGIWVTVGLAGLSAISLVGTVVTSLTPGDKDDAFWARYFGWIPSFVPAKTALKIIGKGKVDVKDVERQRDDTEAKFQRIIRELGEKLKTPLIIGLLGLSALGLQSCAHLTGAGGDGEPPTQKEKIRANLEMAQDTIAAVRAAKPALYESVDALCIATEDDWCAELPVIKKDFDDALDVSEEMIAQAEDALDSGEIKSAQEAVGLAVRSVSRLVGVYVRIITIIERHSDGADIDKSSTPEPVAAVRF